MASYYELITREVDDNGVQKAQYRCQLPAQGAWNDHEQHMAPATGVISKELELFNPRDDMRIGRISLDIFGLIHLDDFTITTRNIRPGRTIELLEATMESKGKVCIVARAWRMIKSDTSEIFGLEDQSIPGPEGLLEWSGMQSRWAGGYIHSLKLKADDSRRLGKGFVWVSNDLDMVAGEPTSAFVKLMGMVDTSNGIVPRQKDDCFNFMFPNLDLQIHLYRMPEGEWLGLDTVQQYGSDGIGLTSTVLHDCKGPFGRGEQILTVRPMPKKS